MTDRTLSAVQVLALCVVAEASMDERLGVPVDQVQPERRLIYRSLVAQGLAYVSSPRRQAVRLGLADPGWPDLYVITEDGAQVVLDYLT